MSVKEPLNGGTAYVPPPDDNFVWYKADNERLRGLLREAREYLPEHHPIRARGEVPR